MERSTSKTMDAFVEFFSLADAANAVQRYNDHRQSGRAGRLGNRHVDIEVYNQIQLMKELFPRARNVIWHGCVPEVTPRDLNDRYNSEFKGFISSEDLIMVGKHAEIPQRVSFPTLQFSVWRKYANT